MKKIFVLTMCFIFIFSLSAFALTPIEIIKKSQDIMRGKSSKGTMEMHIVKPEWQRTLVMDYWEKGNDKFFTIITSPKKEKGVSSLKIDKSMWNYLPKIEKVMKIPPSLMSQSWLGSDFTNDDLVKETSIEDDYTHKLLGEEQIDGLLSYKIELIPKPEAAIVWGKVISFIDKKNFLPVRDEFYSEKGVMERMMKFSDIKIMHGRLLPAKMEMLPLNKPGQSTTLIYKDIEFDTEISDDIFSLRNLKKE